MTGITKPVRLYMTANVHSVLPDETLPNLVGHLIERDLSCMAVVNQSGALTGVITRTDMLRTFNWEFDGPSDQPMLTIPPWRVDEVMVKNPISVSSGDSISMAARCMVKDEVHRVFVEDDGELVGVLSTRDVMLAVRDARVQMPLSEFSSSLLFTIDVGAAISEAVELLSLARISGLLVTDDGWPVGVFTQREALAFGHLASATSVEQVMNPSIVCLPTHLPLYRAAAHAVSMQARKVVVTEDNAPVGIVTGFDFARAAM